MIPVEIRGRTGVVVTTTTTNVQTIVVVVVATPTATVVVTTVGKSNNNNGATNTATRGGNDGGNRGGINGGSIINASGQQMKLPATLSTQYCGHFLDTELRCNFGNSCKKDHSSFPTEFADGDVKRMLSFVDSTKESIFFTSPSEDSVGKEE